MIESAKNNSDSTSEIATYHKVKRVFLNLMNMEKERPRPKICEFKGQN
jgi:hypothetical protein